MTPSSAACGDGGALISFLRTLQNQDECFRCSPESLDGWLISEDVVSLADLAKAWEDDDYHRDLINNGLKGFSRLSFLKTVEKAMIYDDA